MPFSPKGRPSKEVSAWGAIQGNPVVRPFNDFGVLGTSNDTAVIQDAIDWSASGGGAVGAPGIFAVDGLVIKDGAQIICPGRKATKFVPVSGGTAKALFLLDTGPVQFVTLQGFSLDATGGAIAGQHGIYFHAVPILVGSVTQGGLWYPTFRDIFIQGFLGEQLWLHGGDDSLQGPHQQGDFFGVVCITDSLTRRAMRLTGQVGQMFFDTACQFDGRGFGATRLNGKENILIERTVDPTTFANNGDIAPYSIECKATIQSNNRGVTIERAQNISFDGAHFEELGEGVYGSISCPGITVRKSQFNQCGYTRAWDATVAYSVGNFVRVSSVTYKCILAHTNHTPPNATYWVVSPPGETAFLCKVSGGSASVMYCAENTQFNFPTTAETTHFVQEFTAQMRLGPNYSINDHIRTVGVTPATFASASTIDAVGYRQIWVDSGVNTLTTILSDLPPGEMLTIRANAGPVTVGSTGNIEFGGYLAPVIIKQNGSLLLGRNDLSGTWFIVAKDAPSSQRPFFHFISVADSPYTVPSGSGTIHVDPSGGAVTINLPSTSTSPPGERVTIRTYTNGAVTINGADGSPWSMANAYQAADFERNGTVGAGAWALVSSNGMPVQKTYVATATTSGLKLVKHGTSTVVGDFSGKEEVDLQTLLTKLYPGAFLTFRDHASPGTILSGYSYDGTGTTVPQLNVEATSLATPNTLVARDGGGGIAVVGITGHLTGNVTGHADTAGGFSGLGVSNIAGSSASVHALIAALNALGFNFNDLTTP